MDEIIRRLVDSNFLELAGLTVDASIPVPELLVNEIIEAALRGNKNITYCRVSIGSQNRVSANLKTPLWPWPLNLKLRVDRSVDFSGSPKIRASLENKVLLGRLGSLFKALPQGVELQKNRVVFDVQSFLTTPEQKRMLEMFKSVEINTEETKVICGVKIGVD